jgi:ATP-dependent Clp protease ATP-binding subunit ClpA
VASGAWRYAAEGTASEVRPEHLLMALLDQQGCLAVRLLEDQGIASRRLRASLDRLRLAYVDGLDQEDADALRAIGIDLDEVVRRIERNLVGLHPARRPGKPRYSRAAKKVLELALREAVALRHHYIGTEHLLLGLARSGDRVVTDALSECGVDRAGLRQAVADAVRRAG